MSEELLKYYNRELAYLRRDGAEFSRKYPKVAGNLRINEESVEDPHVSRLLEGVAFLTAQIRRDLDNQFSEFSDILLGTLFPDFQAPIPSMAIAALQPGGTLTQAQPVKTGTRFETQATGLPSCEFRSGQPVLLSPCEISLARFHNAPIDAPKPTSCNPQSVLQLRVSCTSMNEHVNLATLNLPELKLYLQGQPHLSHELHDLIHQYAIGFALVSPNPGGKLVACPPTNIMALGFAEEEALIPYSGRSFSGYRLLVEHFLFPEKFLFTSLQELSGLWPQTRHVDIYLYFSRPSDELEKHLRKEHIRLNCTTLVNLFEDVMEPVAMHTDEHEYRLIQRHGSSQRCEVVNVTDVRLAEGENIQDIAPYYDRHNPRFPQKHALYWHSRRSSDWQHQDSEAGTDTYLSLVDKRHQARDLSQINPSERIIIRALCCNRNLPSHLPYGDGKPELRALNSSNIATTQCITAPTATTRPSIEGDSRWQLLQHLSLDHFSGSDGSERLRQVLQLHDFRQSAESQALINGIDSVQFKPGIARTGTGLKRGLCHGYDITIYFSRPRYAGASAFLLASILDHFFAQFAHINSYTRLSIAFTGKHDGKYTWPARSGRQVLL